jgi:hypothetical protein
MRPVYTRQKGTIASSQTSEFVRSLFLHDGNMRSLFLHDGNMRSLFLHDGNMTSLFLHDGNMRSLFLHDGLSASEIPYLRNWI